MASTVSDNLIWAVIGQKCTHQVKNPTDKSVFCKHPMNVDGQCCFLYCPLANSQYATVTEEDGLIYLNMKTAERRHMPNKWWEKIQIPKVNGEDVIEEKLKYFVSDQMLTRIIERYHRLQEVIDRVRILRSESRSRIVPWNKKVERRMRSKEKKAIIAARLNDQIEDELLNRLNMGVYGEMYKELTDADKHSEKEKEPEKDKNAVENIEFEENDENEYKDLEQMTSYVSDYSSADEDDIEDIVGQFEFDDWEQKKRKIKQKAKFMRKKRRKIEMEYEHEYETAQHDQ